MDQGRRSHENSNCEEGEIEEYTRDVSGDYVPSYNSTGFKQSSNPRINQVYNRSSSSYDRPRDYPNLPRQPWSSSRNGSIDYPLVDDYDNYRNQEHSGTGHWDPLPQNHGREPATGGYIQDYSSAPLSFHDDIHHERDRERDRDLYQVEEYGYNTQHQPGFIRRSISSDSYNHTNTGLPGPSGGTNRIYKSGPAPVSDSWEKHSPHLSKKSSKFGPPISGSTPTVLYQTPTQNPNQLYALSHTKAQITGFGNSTITAITGTNDKKRKGNSSELGGQGEDKLKPPMTITTPSNHPPLPLGSTPVSGIGSISSTSRSGSMNNPSIVSSHLSSNQTIVCPPNSFDVGKRETTPVTQGNGTSFHKTQSKRGLSSDISRPYDSYKLKPASTLRSSSDGILPQPVSVMLRESDKSTIGSTNVATKLVPAAKNQKTLNNTFSQPSTLSLKIPTPIGLSILNTSTTIPSAQSNSASLIPSTAPKLATLSVIRSNSNTASPKVSSVSATCNAPTSLQYSAHAPAPASAPRSRHSPTNYIEDTKHQAKIIKAPSNIMVYPHSSETSFPKKTMSIFDLAGGQDLIKKRSGSLHDSDSEDSVPKFQLPEVVPSVPTPLPKIPMSCVITEPIAGSSSVNTTSVPSSRPRAAWGQGLGKRVPVKDQLSTMKEGSTATAEDQTCRVHVSESCAQTMLATIRDRTKNEGPTEFNVTRLYDSKPSAQPDAVTEYRSVMKNGSTFSTEDQTSLLADCELFVQPGSLSNVSTLKEDSTLGTEDQTNRLAASESSSQPVGLDTIVPAPAEENDKLKHLPSGTNYTKKTVDEISLSGDLEGSFNLVNPTNESSDSSKQAENKELLPKFTQSDENNIMIDPDDDSLVSVVKESESSSPAVLKKKRKRRTKLAMAEDSARAYAAEQAAAAVSTSSEQIAATEEEKDVTSDNADTDTEVDAKRKRGPKPRKNVHVTANTNSHEDINATTEPVLGRAFSDPTGRVLGRTTNGPGRPSNSSRGRGRCSNHKQPVDISNDFPALSVSGTASEPEGISSTSNVVAYGRALRPVATSTSSSLTKRPASHRQEKLSKIFSSSVDFIRAYESIQHFENFKIRYANISDHTKASKTKVSKTSAVMEDVKSAVMPSAKRIQELFFPSLSDISHHLELVDLKSEQLTEVLVEKRRIMLDHCKSLERIISTYTNVSTTNRSKSHVQTSLKSAQSTLNVNANITSKASTAQLTKVDQMATISEYGDHKLISEICKDNENQKSLTSLSAWSSVQEAYVSSCSSIAQKALSKSIRDVRSLCQSYKEDVTFLSVISKCFHSNDVSARFQANLSRWQPALSPQAKATYDKIVINRPIVSKEILRRKVQTIQTWEALGNHYLSVLNKWLTHVEAVTNEDEVTEANRTRTTNGGCGNDNQRTSSRLSGISAPSTPLIDPYTGQPFLTYPSFMMRLTGDIVRSDYEQDRLLQQMAAQDLLMLRIERGGAKLPDMISPWMQADIHAAPDLPTWPQQLRKFKKKSGASNKCTKPGCDDADKEELLTSKDFKRLSKGAVEPVAFINYNSLRFTTDGRRSFCSDLDCKTACSSSCNCARIVDLQQNQSRVWTDIEKCIFVDKFLQFPKNFSKIASFLNSRTTKDCVKFYYDAKPSIPFKSLLREYENRRRNLKNAWSSSLTASRSIGARLYPSFDQEDKEPYVELPVDDAVCKSQAYHPMTLKKRICEEEDNEKIRKRNPYTQANHQSNFLQYPRAVTINLFHVREKRKRDTEIFDFGDDYLDDELIGNNGDCDSQTDENIAVKSLMDTASRYIVPSPMLPCRKLLRSLANDSSITIQRTNSAQAQQEQQCLSQTGSSLNNIFPPFSGVSLMGDLSVDSNNAMSNVLISPIAPASINAVTKSASSVGPGRPRAPGRPKYVPTPVTTPIPTPDAVECGTTQITQLQQESNTEAQNKFEAPVTREKESVAEEISSALGTPTTASENTTGNSVESTESTHYTNQIVPIAAMIISDNVDEILLKTQQSGNISVSTPPFSQTPISQPKIFPLPAVSTDMANSNTITESFSSTYAAARKNDSSNMIESGSSKSLIPASILLNSTFSPSLLSRSISKTTVTVGDVISTGLSGSTSSTRTVASLTPAILSEQPKPQTQSQVDSVTAESSAGSNPVLKTSTFHAPQATGTRLNTTSIRGATQVTSSISTGPKQDSAVDPTSVPYLIPQRNNFAPTQNKQAAEGQGQLNLLLTKPLGHSESISGSHSLVHSVPSIPIGTSANVGAITSLTIANTVSINDTHNSLEAGITMGNVVSPLLASVPNSEIPNVPYSEISNGEHSLNADESTSGTAEANNIVERSKLNPIESEFFK